MHEEPDIQLLRNYAERGCENSFRALVARHTNFVYSAAIRQVHSPDLACDIAQSVFTDLARKAQAVSDKISDKSSLVGWLHYGTRYLALNHLRDARRRFTNEKQAMEQLLTNSESQADWGMVGPVLDEALESLREEDREALLLRYFKDYDFSAVGLALGVSDDAAQKRVSRALERLREFFVKRGITISASGLAVVLSANAIQAAPVGLAVTISSAALLTGTTALTATALATAKTLTMTTLQKTILFATLVAAVGTGVYEAHQASGLREANQTLQLQQAPLLERLQKIQNDYDSATNQLASLASEVARIKGNNADLLRLRAEVVRLRADSQELAKLKSEDPKAEISLEAKVKLIKQRLDQTPEAQIPELQFLEKFDWLYAANRKIDTEEDYRAVFDELRGRAESNYIDIIRKALTAYLDGNSKQFPTDLSQIKPYFENPSFAEMLDRYQIVPAKSFPQAADMGGDWLISLKVKDSRSTTVLGQTGTDGFDSSEEMVTLASAMKAALDATPMINGNRKMDIHQLLPYLKTPEEKAAYQRLTHGGK